MIDRRWAGAVWNWHEQPCLIALAATPTGRAIILFLVAALVPQHIVGIVVPALALFALAPTRRIEILAAAAVLVLALKVPAAVRDAGALPMLLTMLALVAVMHLVYRAACGFKDFPAWVRRSPFVCLHLFVLGLAGALALLPPAAPGSPAAAWTASGVAAILPFVLWRAAYLMQSGRSGTAGKTRFIDHWFYAFPAWGGSMVPYGKGHDYLVQHRAEGPDAIAAAQLSGLKLLLLALLWNALDTLLQAVVHGQPMPAPLRGLGSASLDWPQLAALIAQGPAAAPLGVRWAVLVIELFEVTLKIAATGHLAIGLLRLFGFSVFRNTYRPLLATSIVEFWNRLYYYFKELLVQFFFFPAYLRWFKKSPRLRIFTAVMLSACVGNFYYHFLRDIEVFAGQAPMDSAAMLASRGLYCLLLGLGLFVSMLREQQRRGKTAVPTRWAPWSNARRIAGVWLFYSLIHIWNVGSPRLEFVRRMDFFLGLFGLS